MLCRPNRRQWRRCVTLWGNSSLFQLTARSLESQSLQHLGLTLWTLYYIVWTFLLFVHFISSFSIMWIPNFIFNPTLLCCYHHRQHFFASHTFVVNTIFIIIITFFQILLYFLHRKKETQSFIFFWLFNQVSLINVTNRDIPLYFL